ncbi:MAG: hypothetical protein IJI05_03665, partial [Erysipelotrichaceae bacterium]|nr:hypothetical protein [Erysipelotrichaceae bacterium]
MTDKRKITIKAGICVFLSFLILAALTHRLNWDRIDLRLNGEDTVMAESCTEYYDEGARVEKVA